MLRINTSIWIWPPTFVWLVPLKSFSFGRSQRQILAAPGANKHTVYCILVCLLQVVHPDTFHGNKPVTVYTSLTAIKWRTGEFGIINIY